MGYNIQSRVGTQPSEQARSIWSPLIDGPAGWWVVERDPRIHMIAERNSEKLNLNLSQCTVLL